MYDRIIYLILLVRGFFAAIASLLNLQLDAVFITLLQYVISG